MVAPGRKLRRWNWIHRRFGRPVGWTWASRRRWYLPPPRFPKHSGSNWKWSGAWRDLESYMDGVKGLIMVDPNSRELKLWTTLSDVTKYGMLLYVSASSRCTCLYRSVIFQLHPASRGSHANCSSKGRCPASSGPVDRRGEIGRHPGSSRQWSWACRCHPWLFIQHIPENSGMTFKRL